MMVDSRLKTIYHRTQDIDPEQQKLLDEYAASLARDGLDGLINGVCTLIYMFTRWLRMACEDHDKDVIEHVVPTVVATMRMMTKTYPPEVIPTMAGMMIAAATDLSPTLWREQFGAWTEKEMNPLEATAVLLAERINKMTEDEDYATRLVTDALTRAGEL
uniref:hypothetical protein n=1 Tax=Streptomyces corallincola TaxID=2851888 RepID=UPI001FEBFFD0